MDDDDDDADADADAGEEEEDAVENGDVRRSPAAVRVLAALTENVDDDADEQAVVYMRRAAPRAARPTLALTNDYCAPVGPRTDGTKRTLAASPSAAPPSPVNESWGAKTGKTDRRTDGQTPYRCFTL